MADQNDMTFGSAPVSQDTPVSSQSQSGSDMTFGSTPVDQDTPASSLASSQPQPETPQSFTTPGGSSYDVGQSVQHSDGTHGEVTGQHPDTRKAIIKWHPDAKQFKVGQYIEVNGEPGTVKGYANNGKLLVEGKWGDFGGTKAISPADVDQPGKDHSPGAMYNSAAYGMANSFLKTASGAGHIVGYHGLDNAQQNASQAQSQNPASGKAGELAADLVQFLAVNGIVKAGTGMLTALPAAEQYAQAAKITKALADHPVLAKLLHAGINGALTQGGISGVQSGGDLGEAAKGAATGAALEGAGEFAPEILGAAKKVGSAIAHPLDTIGSAARGVGDTLNDFAEKRIPSLYPKEIEIPSNAEQVQAKLDSRIASQPAYDQHASDIRKAFVDGLKEKGIDFQIPPDVDVRKLPDLAKTALKNEYQPLYGKVDEALEKEGFTDKYQDLEDNLDQARLAAKEARKVADTKPEGVIGANKAVADAKQSLDEANAILKEQGLDGAVQRASSLYKASKAADEFKTKILSHTQDFNGTLPRVSPDGFNKALNNLKYKARFGGNRLDQLFGEKAGSQLMADTRAAQTRVAGLKDAEKVRVGALQDLKNQANQVKLRRNQKLERL